MTRAKWTGTVRLDRQALAIPTHWRKQKMIFVNSMSDLLLDAAPEAIIREVWEVMATFLD